eukprot:GILK01003580.1.p1 GENE.GILK01003580.1~~GILK01003580.1.p1  ORF type:complete len:245 (-),score=28.46 GILK01003580.1:228-923(-)
MASFATLLSFIIFLAAVHAHSSRNMPFKHGQTLKLECQTEDGMWGPGPVCADTDQELEFKFGTEEFIYCGLKLADKEKYGFVKSLIQQQKAWQCRVPMSADRTLTIPVLIPMWGIVESDHIHINNHLNFVFHTLRDKSGGEFLIGAAIYPMRDLFVFAKLGDTVRMHGSVRWFEGHSYSSSSTTSVISEVPNVLVIVSWCMLTMILSFLLFVVLYHHVFKPRLLQKYLKKD